MIHTFVVSAYYMLPPLILIMVYKLSTLTEIELLSTYDTNSIKKKSEDPMGLNDFKFEVLIILTTQIYLMSNLFGSTDQDYKS